MEQTEALNQQLQQLKLKARMEVEAAAASTAISTYTISTTAATGLADGSIGNNTTTSGAIEDLKQLQCPQNEHIQMDSESTECETVREVLRQTPSELKQQLSSAAVVPAEGHREEEVQGLKSRVRELQEEVEDLRRDREKREAEVSLGYLRC